MRGLPTSARVLLAASLLASAVAVACGVESGDAPPAVAAGGADPQRPADATPAPSANASEIGAPGAFPKTFLFGTAIAGFQVDMGCPTLAASACEDRASDWYQWITTKRITDNSLLFMSKDPPSAGPGFYELYEKDLDNAAGKGPAQLGNNALRLSIEWSRIFPKPTFGTSGQAALKAVASAEGVAFYHRVFAAMRARGLAPFVTVNHYSLPLWIHDGNRCNEDLDACIAEGKGGWADPNRARIVNELMKYAGFLAEEYGGEVDRWASLNEPFSAVVVPGYLASTPMRSNPPGRTAAWMSIKGAKTAAAAMIEAHARIYDAIKTFDRKDADGDGTSAEVGMVYPYADILEYGTNTNDYRVAQDARYFFEDMFMDGACEGRLDEGWDQGPGKAPVRADLANRCDFVGVNYYFRFTAKPGGMLGTVTSTLVSPYLTFDLLAPFDANPKGLYAALKRASKYGKPLYVTETGTTQDDEPRGAAWIVETMSQVKSALKDGYDVRGYFAWSLMDNYEWNLGAGTRMGLYQVHPQTKARAMRDAGEAFAAISKARDVPDALVQSYAGAFPP
jgi:beta-galactosidase